MVSEYAEGTWIKASEVNEGDLEKTLQVFGDEPIVVATPTDDSTLHSSLQVIEMGLLKGTLAMPEAKDLIRAAVSMSTGLDGIFLTTVDGETVVLFGAANTAIVALRTGWASAAAQKFCGEVGVTSLMEKRHRDKKVQDTAQKGYKNSV